MNKLNRVDNIGRNFRPSPVEISPKETKIKPIVNKTTSPTAAQERSGLSAEMQKILSSRALNFIGNIKPNPSAPAAFPNAPLFSEGTSKVNGKPVKDGDAVHYNDVQQGNQNDCYLMASIAAVAKNDPEAIRNMIHENRDASGNVTSYDVTLYKKNNGFLGTGIGGGYDKVNVNVPASEVLKDGAHPADNGELWVKVIETAYAKLNGGTSVWEHGGSPADALPTLTGRGTDSHRVGGGYSFEDLQADVNAGKNVVVNTKSEGEDKGKVKNSDYNLHNWHVYTVEKVYTDADGKKMVQLYNPWGQDHPKPIPFDEMNKYFNDFWTN